LLLQQDPRLTQNDIKIRLQAGAHRVRGEARFYDQSSVGELDVAGALRVHNTLLSPKDANPNLVPAFADSWLAASSDYVPFDGAQPITLFAQLRAREPNQTVVASAIESQDLTAEARIEGIAGGSVSQIQKVAPGLYSFRYVAPAGAGGKRVSIALRSAGGLMTAPIELPIAGDSWGSLYPITVGGGLVGCNQGQSQPQGGASTFLVALMALSLTRRAKRS
jgi:hypothetical protein